MHKLNSVVLHEIVNCNPTHFTQVNTKLFLELCNFVGSGAVTIEEVFQLSASNSDLFCMTFDDGYSSDYEIVFPQLLKNNQKATFFVVTNWIDEPGYLTKSQIKEMHEYGMQIGSHSLSHPNLVKVDRERASKELLDSRLFLEDLISSPVSTFAFPFGFESPSLTALVFEKGYQFCCNSRHGLISVGAPIIPRNSINASFNTAKLERALKAEFHQQILWYSEDKIKLYLKTKMPKFYERIVKLVFLKKS